MASTRLPGPQSFAICVRALAMQHILGTPADEWAAQNGAHPSVVAVLRASVLPGTTDRSNWAGDLHGSEAASIVGDFTASLSNASAFFAMLNRGAFGTVPAFANIALTATAIGAHVVAEGKPTPLSALSIDKNSIAPVKILAMLVASQELLSAAPAAQGLFSRELQSAVGSAVDLKFMSLVTAGLSGTAATSDVLADLRVLLNAVDLRRGQPFFIAASDVAKMLCTAKASSGGERLFEDASPTGGELLGVPLILSSGVADGTLTLLNAGQIAVNFSGIATDVARHASIEMADALTTDSTTQTGAATVSLWQNDLAAIRVAAKFSAKRVRDAAIHQVTGAARGA